jgi:hypothetical protein
MAINPRTIEQPELDLETARGQFAALQLSSKVGDETKVLAAAIAQAGGEIALEIADRGGDRSGDWLAGRRRTTRT